MEPEESNSKRKQPEPTPLSGWLHPGDSGEWRGNKRPKSVSRSRSPSPSGVSTPSEAGTNEPTRSSRSSRSLAKLLPRSRERSQANAIKPSSQASPAVPQGSAKANVTTPIQNPPSAARSGLEEVFRKLRIVTGAICPPLCSAIDDLTTCLHVFEAAANNHQEYNDLTDELKSLVEQLIRHLHAAPSEDIIDSISIISEAIRKEIESIGVRQSRGGIQQRLDASSDDEDLRRRYRRIKQLFQQIMGEASMSTWNITSEHFMNTQLEGLHPAKLARFDSSLSNEINRRICTENTRTKILQGSLKWSEDPNGAKMYWMNGMAGTGKTTIATTLSATLEARKQLAASFFCTRTSPECREAKRIVPTIAYQLSRRSTPFRSVLCKALKEDPDISTGSISSQFELLIRRPLIKVKDKLANNLVIVVDALDECNDPHIVELFLGLLFSSIKDLPIKFYVTSRPEPAIRNRMISESERTRSILYLHEIEKSLVQADIELYLQEELAFMSPVELNLKKLAEHAGSLFIYAATAVRYIRPTGKAVDSQARLATILAVNAKSEKILPGIDALYSAILAAAIDDPDLEPEERENIRLVLWTAICACEPILVGTLSALCGLNNKNSTVNALQPLRSVLHISDHSALVTTLHASFPEYMLARSRSGVFFCDKASHSHLLAQRCFGIMQSQLRFNIGSIQSSFIPDNQIADLKDQITANISSELFYTCRFWADHLSQTPIVDNPLLLTTHRFLSDLFLFWMEVLNLKGCLSAGVLSVTKLNKWLLRNEPDAHPELCALAFDASGFLISYISSSASAYTPHIYLSLLPLSSRSSPLYLCYYSRFKGLVKLSDAITDKLVESALSSWRSEIEPNCAAFSPSSDVIALGSLTGAISIQDVYDGNYLVQPYKAHKTTIECLEISSNGMWMVSGSSDSTLSIWSTKNGSLLFGPFVGHTAGVTSVRFSPNDAHIASGSLDCTVGIWNTNDATTPMRLFTGHTDWVNSVDFSPDGARVISSSHDNTIHVWDLSSGAIIFIIQGQQNLAHVTCVRFTPDGACIITATIDRCLQIWDASNGSPHSAFQGSSNWDVSMTMALSPEGDRIASTSNLSNQKVCVWNRRDGFIAEASLSHTSVVRFLGFSDDGMRLVSVSADKTVRVWNVHGREKKHLPDIAGKNNSLDFITSPNRSLVAEVLDSAINIWDLRTAALVTSISFMYGCGSIMFLQFSLDGTRIFAMHDWKLYTWKTDTAELIDAHYYLERESSPISAACSVDGTRVVVLSQSSVELWDAQSHRRVAYLGVDRHTSDCRIKFSNSRRFATELCCRSEHIIQVWDADSGKCVAGPFSMEGLLDISLDGSAILCSTHVPSTSPDLEAAHGLYLINVNSGETTFLNDMPYKDGFETAMFTLDGLYVISSSSGRCEIWDIQSRTATRIRRVWTGSLQSFSYSPSGWCQAYSILEGMKGVSFQAKWFRVDQPFASYIDPGGWLPDSESRPLLWVPQEIRKELPWDSEVRIENGESLQVDYRDMLVGDEWSKCYIGD
ncbi:hypothetical protein ACGC1H_003480 [Rhizoctonia solani]